MKTKTFDCVEMKHRGAEKIRVKIGHMTKEEELAFWQECSQILRQRQKMTTEQGNAPKEVDGKIRISASTTISTIARGRDAGKESKG